jgi:hypothetical protein
VFLIKPDDDYAPGAISVTASAPDTAYPPENTVLDNPANPGKLTTPTGWFLYEYANKIQPVGASLVYQYLLAGLNVRLQASTSSSFASPALDFAFTIPPKRRDGPSFQRWTVNPWIRLTAAATWGDPAGYKFWRVLIVGTNDQNVIIGKIMLFSALHQVQMVAEGGDLAREKDYEELSVIRDRTEVGVKKRQPVGGPMRQLSFTLAPTNYSAGTLPIEPSSTLRELLQDAESDVHPWGIIPWEDNDFLLVDVEDFTWERGHKVGGYEIWQLSVREVSRGVPFP